MTTHRSISRSVPAYLHIICARENKPFSAAC
jgi:hypothetical protein